MRCACWRSAARSCWRWVAGPGLEQMLALFPPAQFERHADLHLLRGLLAFSRYDWDTLYEAMHQAAAGYARAGRRRDEAVASAYACAGLHHIGRKDEASTQLQALRALDVDDAARAVILYISAWDAFAGERSEEVVAFVAAMLDCLERMPDVRLWLQCANLSLLVGLPGMGALLERFAVGVTRVAGQAPSQLRAAMLHVRAGQAIGAGRLDEAWDWLQRADEDCRWLGRPRLLMTDNALTHVLLHALRGEPEACFRHGQQAYQDVIQNSAPSHRRVHLSDVLAVRARAAWLLGDADTQRRVDQLLHEATHPWEWASAARCRAWSRAFVALLDGRLDEARTPARADGPRHRALPLLRRRAGAFHGGRHPCPAGRTGRGRRAAAPVVAAGAAGRRQGRRAVRRRGRAAAAGGAALGRPARCRAARAAASAAGTARPRARPQAGRRRGAGPGRPRHLGLEELSERECEVLERIAAGDSNKLIARAFQLSPHTVKRHVANILDKLGVQTRGQAAARWRQQG